MLQEEPKRKKQKKKKSAPVPQTVFLNFRQPNQVEPLSSYYQQRNPLTNIAQSYYTVVNQTLAKNAF
jgi:hypothetical protein